MACEEGVTMPVTVTPFPSVLHPEIAAEESFSYKIVHSTGSTFSVINYGASITNIFVPDKNGRMKDVILGFSDLDAYLDNKSCHGAIVGRHANRIKGATFSIGEIEYHVTQNDGLNNLHSGPHGFHNIFWHGSVLTKDKAQRMLQESHIDNPFELDGDAVLFTCFSPDQSNGFPGNLTTSVLYAWTTDLTLMILYRGESDKDTIFNPTNHAYFNLGGHDSGSVHSHLLWIESNKVTNKDAGNVPDGTYSDVEGTIFDFTVPNPLGATMSSQHPQILSSLGIDQNYCLSTTHEAVRRIAQLSDPVSGRIMEVLTNSPGLQIYTGNHINYAGKDGVQYARFGGVCLETQEYPDAIHHLNFPSSILPAHEQRYYITGYRYSFKS
jgi:aldose 1-epimerase